MVIHRASIAVVVLSIALSFIFFASYYSAEVHVSPDNNARWYFDDLIASKGVLHDDINNGVSYGGTLRPRNAININGSLVPQSFLGPLMIEGVIASLTGSQYIFQIMFFVTIGLYFMIGFKLLEFFTNDKLVILAILSCVLISPLSNVLTLSGVLILVVLYYFFRFLQAPSYRYLILTFLFYGLCVLLRYELILLLFPVVLISFFCRKSLDWRKFFLIFFSLLGIVFSVVLLLNKSLYGGYWNVGYNFDPQSSDAGYYAAPNLAEKLLSYALPYGVNFLSVGDKLLRYVLILLPFTIISLAVIVYHSKKPYYRLFFLSLLLLIGLFSVYYGSNPHFYNFQKTTLDSSYVRYFSFFIVFLVMLSGMAASFAHRYFKLFLIPVVLVIVVLNSVIHLHDATQQYSNYENIQQRLLNLTTNNTILITYYWDKLVWPERYVVTSSSSVVSGDDLVPHLRKMESDGFEVVIFPDSPYFDDLQENPAVVLTSKKYLGMYDVDVR